MARILAAHGNGDLFEDLITKQMAVIVVDSLEVIQVDHCQAQGCAVCSGQLTLGFQLFKNGFST